MQLDASGGIADRSHHAEMNIQLSILFCLGCAVPLTSDLHPADAAGTATALAKLDVDVWASIDTDQSVTISVGVSDPAHFLAPTTCFTAGSELHVFVDGELAKLTYPGGLTTPGGISGIELPRQCGGAQFQVIKPRGSARPGDTHITLEQGLQRADVVVSQLTAQRTLRMIPAGSVSPGDDVTVEWSHRDDIWSGESHDPTAWIFRPGSFSVETPLAITGSSFHFKMPVAPPGLATLELRMTGLRAHAPLRGCRGVRKCNVGETNLAPSLAITVAPH